jgi:transposase
MRLDYRRLILESEAELSQLERRLRGSGAMPRVQMLRMLKSGQVQSLRACAPLLGYSLRQLNRWWEQYQQGGIGNLTETNGQGGRQSQLTVEAAAGLRKAIEAGEIRQLEDARRYLSEQWNIHYASLNGVWWMLRREGMRILRNAEQRAGD